MDRELWRYIPPHTYTLERRGQNVLLSPPIRGLENVFYTRRSKGKGGKAVRAEPLLQLRAHPDCGGRLCMMGLAGLQSLLLSYLKGVADADVEVRRDRHDDWPPLNIKNVARLKSVDRRMLDFVDDGDRGVIRYGRRVCPASLVAQMVLAWPEQTFLIVTTLPEEARELTKKLNALGANAACYDELFKNPSERVLVGSVQSVGGSAGSVTSGEAVIYRQVLVAMNPSQLFDRDGPDASYVKDIFEGLRRARAFGMFAADTKVSPRIRDHLTAFFGTRVLDIPRHGRKPRDVEVMFESAHQRGIFGQGDRNSRVVSLAKLALVPDGGRIYGDYDYALGHLDSFSDGRVCVLASNAEHAHQLAVDLGWPVFASADGDDAPTASTPAMTTTMGTETPARCFITTAAALRNAGRIDVLIRADGGDRLIQLPRQAIEVPESSKRTPLAIVDFDDHHPPQLREATRARHRAYWAAGWKVNGLEPNPLHVFLDNRPEIVE
jgi:hypothetical protein